MHRDELENHLNQLLDIPRFHDYCPNGLQVEGRSNILTMISGVTASLDLLQAAAQPRQMPFSFTMAISGAERIHASPA